MYSCTAGRLVPPPAYSERHDVNDVGNMMQAFLAGRRADPPAPIAAGSSAFLRRLDLTNVAPSLSRNNSAHGLELLRAASLRVPNANTNTLKLPMPVLSPTTSSSIHPAVSNKSADGKVYIDEIRDLDCIAGRGGKSNHHPGNKRYRQVISEMKACYRRTEAKTVKTDLSRAIVDHVCAYGGRFVKKCEKTSRFYMLTKAEARKKTSQALRETKALKWTS